MQNPPFHGNERSGRKLLTSPFISFLMLLIVLCTLKRKKKEKRKKKKEKRKKKKEKKRKNSAFKLKRLSTSLEVLTWHQGFLWRPGQLKVLQQVPLQPMQMMDITKIVGFSPNNQQGLLQGLICMFIRPPSIPYSTTNILGDGGKFLWDKNCHPPRPFPPIPVWMASISLFA